jgi:hypothetical protein
MPGRLLPRTAEDTRQAVCGCPPMLNGPETDNRSVKRCSESTIRGPATSPSCNYMNYGRQYCHIESTRVARNRIETSWQWTAGNSQAVRAFGGAATLSTGIWLRLVSRGWF